MPFEEGELDEHLQTMHKDPSLEEGHSFKVMYACDQCDTQNKDNKFDDLTEYVYSHKGGGVTGIIIFCCKTCDHTSFDKETFDSHILTTRSVWKHIDLEIININTLVLYGTNVPPVAMLYFGVTGIFDIL